MDTHITDGLRKIAEGILLIAEGIETDSAPKFESGNFKFNYKPTPPVPIFDTKWHKAVFRQASVLDRMEKEGVNGTVVKEDFYAFGSAAGYKRQGLSGFTLGNPSDLVKITGIEGECRTLTKAGKKRLDYARQLWPEWFN